MPVFRNINGKLQKLELLPIEKEQTLQKLIENNLLEVLDMKFLYSEYPTTHGGRIDTLAIDSSGIPVLIEYKLHTNQQVISQALFYLEWLKSQTIEFYKGLTKEKFDLGDLPAIDWRNPRAICIAESYSKYDTVGFRSVPGLELYKYHFYGENIFILDRIYSEDMKFKTISNGNSKSILDSTIDTDRNSSIKTVVNELENINKSNLEKQLLRKSKFIKSLFNELEKLIKALDENIYEKANNKNIVFGITKVFAEVHVQMDNILIHLNQIEHDYPEEVVLNVPKERGWGKKVSIRIKDIDDLNYKMPLIEKSYYSVL